MMNLKNINTKTLAKEFINESEYLRTVSYNDIAQEDYNRKNEYVNSIRAELANRGLSYKEIRELAK